MTGEVSYAQSIVIDALAHADRDPALSKDAMGRSIINAVLAEYSKYRTSSDIASELQYILDNLDEDEFVITRGC
jgi:hypothetical protein